MSKKREMAEKAKAKQHSKWCLHCWLKKLLFWKK
jgi:hypothetical protein